MTKAEPLPGEKLVMRFNPHPVAFWHLWAISGLLIFLGYSVGQLYTIAGSFKIGFPIPLLQRYNIVNLSILWGVLMGTAIIIGLIYIRLTPLLAFGTIALAGTILTEYFKMPLDIHIWLLVLCGVVGFVMTEFYRRGHNYYITNLRIVMEKSFISHDSRQLTYDKINDLALVQGLIGRILNYGNVIPVTASGLGLGEDSAFGGLGGGVGFEGRPRLPLRVGLGLSASGGRAVQIPRGRTYHTLYGAPRPREVQELIARMIQGQASGPYLERMTSGVERLLSQKQADRYE